jgi:hypothetical protein
MDGWYVHYSTLCRAWVRNMLDPRGEPSLNRATIELFRREQHRVSDYVRAE